MVSLGLVCMLLTVRITNCILPVPEMKENLKVAYFGDNMREDFESATAVLQFVERQNVDMIIVVGDLGYRNSALMWCDTLNDLISSNVTVFATPGESDRELDQWFVAEEDIPNSVSYVQCLINFSPASYQHCEGIAGILQVCVYQGLFVLLLGYDLAYGDGTQPWGRTNEDYLAFAEQKLSEYASVLWKVCAFHFSTGKYTVTGTAMFGNPELLDLCRQHGAMIVGGNSHSYSRTYVMSNFMTETMVSQAVGQFKPNALVMSPGQSLFIVSGLGGASVHILNQDKAAKGFWPVYAAKGQINFGALFCVYNFAGESDVAKCDFKEINTAPDVTFDSFYLRASLGTQVPTVLPTKTLTTAVTYLPTAPFPEITAMPSEITAMPSEITAMPSEITAMPSESTAIPSESTAIPTKMPTQPLTSRPSSFKTRIPTLAPKPSTKRPTRFSTKPPTSEPTTFMQTYEPTAQPTSIPTLSTPTSSSQAPTPTNNTSPIPAPQQSSPQQSSPQQSQQPAPQQPTPQQPTPQQPTPQYPAPQHPVPQYPVPQYPVPQQPATQQPATQQPAPQQPQPQIPVPQVPAPPGPVPQEPTPLTPHPEPTLESPILEPAEDSTPPPDHTSYIENTLSE